MSKQKSLSEIQNLLQHSVQSKTLSVMLLDIILEKPPISISERINIYHEAYYIRLSESIKSDFEETKEKVGEEIFNNLVNDFIRKTPSQTQNLAEYSAHFPEYIKDARPDLYELSSKEWLKILSENAAEPDDKLSLADIESGLSFELRKHPASIVKKFGNKTILAYRSNHQVHFTDLNEVEADFLVKLNSPTSLDKIAEYGTEHGLGEEYLMSLVSYWTQHQIIFCQGVAT